MDIESFIECIVVYDLYSVYQGGDSRFQPGRSRSLGRPSYRYPSRGLTLIGLQSAANLSCLCGNCLMTVSFIYQLEVLSGYLPRLSLDVIVMDVYVGVVYYISSGSMGVVAGEVATVDHS